MTTTYITAPVNALRRQFYRGHHRRYLSPVARAANLAVLTTVFVFLAAGGVLAVGR